MTRLIFGPKGLFSKIMAKFYRRRPGNKWQIPKNEKSVILDLSGGLHTAHPHDSLLPDTHRQQCSLLTVYHLPFSKLLFLLKNKIQFYKTDIPYLYAACICGFKVLNKLRMNQS